MVLSSLYTRNRFLEWCRRAFKFQIWTQVLIQAYMRFQCLVQYVPFRLQKYWNVRTSFAAQYHSHFRIFVYLQVLLIVLYREYRIWTLKYFNVLLHWPFLTYYVSLQQIFMNLLCHIECFFLNYFFVGMKDWLSLRKAFRYKTIKFCKLSGVQPHPKVPLIYQLLCL